MFCPNCGHQLSDTAKFCPECGCAVSVQPDHAPEDTGLDAVVPSDPDASLADAPETAPVEKPKRKRKPAAKKMMQQGSRVSENIYLCEDGKYRWIYEMSLFKNPTIIVLVWKIFFFILLGIFAFTMLMDVFGGDMNGERFLETLKILAYFIIGMTVLCALGYLLYAAIMGGKYIVMFEMDEEGVNHKQMPKQAKKAEIISLLTALAGIASRNTTTVGIGLTSARTEMYTRFSNVRKVKAYPSRDLIKINERLMHNQVYAEKEDFEFVYSYISDHVAMKKEREK